MTVGHRDAHRHCQTFTFGAWRWCIDLVDTLIGRDPDVATFYPSGDITNLAAMLPLIRIAPEHAMATDIAKPLTIAPLPSEAQYTGAIVIDGWHRVYRALRENRTHLPMYLISPATEQAARIAR